MKLYIEIDTLITVYYPVASSSHANSINIRWNLNFAVVVFVIKKGKDRKRSACPSHNGCVLAGIFSRQFLSNLARAETNSFNFFFFRRTKSIPARKLVDFKTT